MGRLGAKIKNEAWLLSTFFRLLKRLMPNTMFGRSLLIVVLPIILLQVLVTYIFYERHWDNVARRLAQGVAGEVAAVISLTDRFPGPEARASILTIARDQMRLAISFEENGQLNETEIQREHSGFLDRQLARALQESLPARNFTLTSNEKLESVVIRLQLPNDVLQIVVRDKRLFSSTTYIFVMWMIAISLALLGIAVIFLRNQMRPIKQLASAAEKFGRGQEVEDFKPSGALEIRSASKAFHDMKHRILRQITQRTEMLAGVSHDLRTPLTRMKLQLAMMPEDQSRENLQSDVEDMRNMVEGYLAFAKGQEAETVQEVNVTRLIESVVENARRQGAQITLTATPEIRTSIRANSVKRCLTNLVENARRHATEIAIAVYPTDSQIVISIDDNGPGIPLEKRQDVFKPFHRLDTSRNSETGGSGLGMTIARDVVHGHGGQIALGRSSMGGLHIELTFPY
ncbi:ATP-binding protein [Sneathiella aquimaris]|uniref:ATP-binding protein n=1 Tax=Sneathiella aquimaris TaxID=2599305 RepID=UPI00146D3C85|nr:ATP-binding protein [Sneathiella aquimaris]